MIIIYFLLFLLVPFPFFIMIDFDNKEIVINKIKLLDLKKVKSRKINNKKQPNKEKTKINKKKLASSILESYYSMSSMRFKPILWFKCTLTIGTGEASSTGILYGFIYIIASLLKKFILDSLFINKSYLNIYPLWNQKAFNSKTKILIFIMPLFLIIYIIILLKNYISIDNLQRRQSNV